ncbi:MAG: guanylate kinase [Actinobacteria bacterium]|nr:MAG: guanylate kinase [Actinomycetota bacterium]TMM25407.1 MAG: guanylate kinase [Actinomycetota bacterium]
MEGCLSASAPSSSGSSTGKRPPVFVITGTSGEGKSTLAKMLLERVPELALAVSATTRDRRPGEEDGREYHFISREEFDRRLAADEFLEWVEWPWGEHKRAGTLWSEIERITGSGRPVLLELETGGALAVRDRIPGSVTIFITAPNREELERRLRARGTESEGEIEERLAQALEQSKLAGEFSYTIVNDDLDRAIDELEGIVRREIAAAGSISGP